MTDPTVGDRVRIERDESCYPSRGTWPQFRGKTGTVVEINQDRQRPHLTEYGLTFSRVTPRTDGRGAFNWDASGVTWFKAHELTAIRREAAVRPVGRRSTHSRYNHPQETAA